MEFEITPCKTREKFKVRPKKNVRIDMDRLKAKFKVKIYTPVACIINVDSEEIVVHRYGELRFKTLQDKEKIKKISAKIFSSCTSS